MQQAPLIYSFASTLGYEFYMSGFPTNNSIWLFWNSDVQGREVNVATQSISLVLNVYDAMTLQISIAYAKCKRLERNDL